MIKRRLLWLLVGCSGIGLSQCHTSAAEKAPTSPQQAWHELSTAIKKKDSRRIYQLLDTSSRWSIMSIHKDQQAICALVQKHYPADRQARELQRCRAAATTKEPEVFFVQLAQDQQFVPSTLAQGPRGQVTLAGDRATIATSSRELPFCREKVSKRKIGWLFCGLRAPLEQLKVKVARDLLTVQENVQIYQK